MLTLALLVLACAPPASPPPSPPEASAAHGPAAPGPATSGPAAPSAAGPTSAPALDAPLSPPAVVQVGLVGATSDAGLYIAQEKGYFTQQGLTVEFSQFQSGEQMVPLLGSGQLDVGGGATSAALINAVARDIPIRIVADKGSLPPGFGYQAIVVRKDLVDSGAFQGCPSFKGMRVANTADSDGARPALERMLAECGLALSDIDLVIMGNPDMPAAFRNGAIEASRMLEPGLSRGLEEDLFAIYKRGDEIYPNQQIAVLLYSPNLIANHREVGQRFMVAYVQGLRDHWDAFTRGINKAEIIDILTRTTAVKSPALFEQMVPPGLNPDGYINLTTFGADVNWWADHGYVQTRIDPAQVVDHSFVDYAVGRLGKYAAR
jgi:NitT/TauT family transport system substrate-binding protein